MIRAIAINDKGQKVLLLGVDDENIRRLTNAEPIVVTPASMHNDIDMEVMIIHGHTLQDVVDFLRKSGVEFPSMPHGASS